MRALVLLVLLLSIPLVSAYPDPGKVPVYYPSACYDEHTKRFVHDYLGIVPPEYAREMEGAACEIYRKTSAHFVLLTVPDTEGETLENYAFHLFEAWGIGDAERHDGILMMYVADYAGSGEPALRIEVGYGLEPVVTASVAEDTWDLMVDARDRALDAGENGTSARVYAMAMGMAYLLAVVRDGYTEAGFPEPDPAPASANDAGETFGQILFNVLTILAVIALIAYLVHRAETRGGRPGWGYTGPSSPSWNSPGSRIWTGGGGSYGGGGFGGGGSFGGGRSGGGGRGGKF